MERNVHLFERKENELNLKADDLESKFEIYDIAQETLNQQQQNYIEQMNELSVFYSYHSDL